MTDLSELLKKIISKDFDDNISRVCEVWSKCAGRLNGKGSRPLYLKGGRLTVQCDSSSLLFELRGARLQIMDRLNDYLGKGTVKDIYFRQ